MQTLSSCNLIGGWWKESNPVGFLPPVWKPYVIQFQWPHQMLLRGVVTLPEQVWTSLQWSPPDVTRGFPDLMSGERYPTWPGGRSRYLPCDLSHDAFDATPSPWTVDTCENNTFPQLSLQAVIKKQCLSTNVSHQEYFKSMYFLR